MIRVKVVAPFRVSRGVLDERGWIELREGATVRELQKALGMPGVAAKMFRPHINGAKQPPSAVLRDGDVVSYFSMIRGG